MTPDQVAMTVMEAVELHETIGCGPAIRELQGALSTHDESFEAAWILSERVVARLTELGHPGVVVAGAGPTNSDLLRQVVVIVGELLALALVPAREAAASRWAATGPAAGVAAVFKLFHLSIEVGAWTREGSTS